MKKNYLMLLFSCVLCACSGQPSKEVIQQIHYSKTHTGYADSATLHYALQRGITPDSALIVLGSAKL